MTYVASYFHAFSSQGGLVFMLHETFVDISSCIWTDQAETVSRRIEKFAELMQSIWVSRNDYERRVRAVRERPLY